MKATWLACVIVLVMGCPVLAQNQVTPEKRAAASDAVYDLLQQYQKHCHFRELGGVTISDDEIQQYLTLFADTGVKVLDDIDATDIPSGNFTMKTKSVQQYVTDVKASYPKGLTVRITKATISFDSLAKGMVYVAIEKEVSATNKDGRSLSSKDTLQLDVKVTNDTSAAIVGIESLGGTLTCSNCPKPVVIAAAPVPKPAKTKEPKPEKKPASSTVVVVEKKQKPSQPKPFFALDFQLDGPLTIAKTSAPNINKFNYPNLITSDSYITNYSSGSPSGAFSFSLMGNLVFPTKKKMTVGVGLGLMANVYRTKLKADSIHLQYEATDNEGVNFMRIFEASNVTENLKTLNLGIPLLLKLQTDTSKKVGLFVHAGPIILVYNSTTSDPAGTMNHGAVYQYRNGEFTFDPTGTIEPTDWVITSAFASEHATSTSAAIHYSSDPNVAFDESISGKEKFKFNIGVGGLLRAGVAINTSKTTTFTAGIELMYAEVTGNKQYDATLTDGVGIYNSMLYAVNQYSIFNYGITLGFQIKFIKAH